MKSIFAATIAYGMVWLAFALLTSATALPIEANTPNSELFSSY
jgi:hypothetical protein